MKRILTTLLALLLSQPLTRAAQSLPLQQEEEEVGAQPVEEPAKSATWTQQVEDWYSLHMGYGSVMLLMAIESSFIPFPSEVVIPPAAYVAERPDSSLHATGSTLLNLLLIALAGTLGSVLGALFNYLLSLWLGRPIIYRFADSKAGHLLMLSGEKIRKAEDYFNEHGNMSTFVCRFIPAIRQLVSIPAGIAKMPLAPFVGFTFLGAFLWNCVLVAVGYIAGGQKEAINQYSHELSLIILALVAVAAVWFIVRHVMRKKQQ